MCPGDLWRFVMCRKLKLLGLVRYKVWGKNYEGALWGLQGWFGMSLNQSGVVLAAFYLSLQRRGQTPLEHWQ